MKIIQNTLCSIWGFKQSLLDNGFKPRGMQVRLESFLGLDRGMNSTVGVLGRLKERDTSIVCIERNKSLTCLAMDMVPTMVHPRDPSSASCG